MNMIAEFFLDQKIKYYSFNFISIFGIKLIIASFIFSTVIKILVNRCIDFYLNSSWWYSKGAYWLSSETERTKRLSDIN